ncbi:uncharacterized protein isoform X2 [Rhodnius prolixus]|uniref:uncharacterized protein isoform X2 n=1 Tax=Rhodnius prolixus TaxID=13249 RepID=UPI003D187A0F
MDEVLEENIYGERTIETLEEMTELSLVDESWSELLDPDVESKYQWDDSPLSEDLRRLDEEQKQHIADARAWVDEEVAMDEMLRKDIAELQLAINKNLSIETMQKDDNLQLTSTMTAEISPETEEKMNELENKIKHLQNMLDEKSQKVIEVSEMYTEILNKLNERRERSLSTDREFKASFARIKKDYAEVEALLKSEIERQKARAKQQQFKLTEKEIEVSELRQEREDLLNSKSAIEAKYKESTATIESLNKELLKLEIELKNVKAENDSLKKEKENAEDLTSLRDRLALLEEEKEAATVTQKKHLDLENSFTELKNSTSFLENENNRIISNYEKAEAKIKEQQIIIENFLKSAQQSEEQKIIAIMRSVELEEQLSFREKEISQLKESFTKLETQSDHHMKTEDILSIPNDELLERVKILEHIKMQSDELIEELKGQLTVVENTLKNYQSENLSLKDTLDGLYIEKDKLEKDLIEIKSKERSIKSEMTMTSSGSPATQVPESDPLYHKFKKVVANYKLKTKLCQDLEVKLENITAELADKDSLINKITSEKQQLEEYLSSSNLYINELSSTIEMKTDKIKKLISVVEKLCSIDEGVLGEDADSAVLNLEKWNNTKEANVQLVQQQMNTVLFNVAKLEDEIEEMKKSIKERDDAISELEDERTRLSDVVTINEKELEMLRAMYDKVSEKNEHFYTDLMSIEREMASGKTELLSRLEVVTQNYDKCLLNLQERENYIETLEQDIVTMKSKMYNIESGMDERQRILKETSDQLMAKFQAAEIMNQTFEKYKSEVESKIGTLKGQKREAEENELLLKEEIIKLKTDRDFTMNEKEDCERKIEELIQENETSQSQILAMKSELDTLRDIRNSYNTTLDKIEELNSELTQTALSFELKNQRLEMLEQERMELVNKLSDLEDAYTDLEGKLEEYVEVNNNLKNEINSKLENLKQLENENSDNMNRIRCLEQTCHELEGKLTICTNENFILNSEMNLKTEKLVKLEHELVEITEKCNCYEHSCSELGRKFQECTDRNNNLESELIAKNRNLSEANQKLFDLQTKLVESEAMCASLQDELTKMETDLQCVRVLQEENRLQHNKEETGPVESQAMSVFTWTDQGAAAPDNPFGDIKDEEDGWGWMAQEATLEHDHKHSEALKIQELTSKLSKVTEEKDQYLNELISTKTKCQKLMKKIKEIKTINENLEKAKNVGLSDLDFAIQEELRAENDKLQAKVNELNSQISVLKTEKDSMTKRLDILISANEQLVDLKERQDLEVQMWQKKSNQLTNEVKFLKSSLESKEGNLDDKMPDQIAILINENNELKLILEAKKRELEAKTKEIDWELPEKFAALSCENEELIAVLNLQKSEHESKLNEYIQNYNGLEAEKEKLLHKLHLKEQQIHDLSLNVVDSELSAKYAALVVEYENIKVLLNAKEMELKESIRQKEQQVVTKLAVDFTQQTDFIENTLSVQESGQHLKMFSFEDNQEENKISKELQINKELGDLKARVQSLTEEKVGLENYIFRLEEELQILRGAEEEALLKASRDRDDLSGHLEDVKREAALWRQKADELLNEVEAKEELYYNLMKHKEKEYQQNLLTTREENAYLVNTLSTKEQSLKEVTMEVDLLRSEVERLKNTFSAEKNTLEEEVKTLKSQSTLSKAEDNPNYFNQVISELQDKLDDTIKETLAKETIIEDLKQKITSYDEGYAYKSLPEERLQSVEGEKIMIETLLKERQAEVESLRQELTTLLKRKAETQEHDDTMTILEDKDKEIGRLTKSVVEMQERLLRMEEGKLRTSIEDLQNRLDKALYTAHISDVRCEELTHEIMQLLEERDTLQFRLAEALRVIENNSTKEESISRSSSPLHSSLPSQSSPVNEKLNKIRHEYERDPTVQLERKSRHMQHMQLYSPTSEESTSADYGFFNWFFGGSPQGSTQPQSQSEES